MAHFFEQASTGRATCRGCGTKIAAKAWRFGERRPNPYGDEGTEVTHWFHVPCAAYRRPEPFLETLATPDIEVADRERLEHAARLGMTHERLPLVSTAERASTGRATCRHCREAIAKDSWRIALLYYEDGQFSPSGFIHARCATPHVGTAEVMDRIRHFSPALTEADLIEVRTDVDSAGAGTS
jgi:hypothetical protein